jgi:hypothetical protein
MLYPIWVEGMDTREWSYLEGYGSPIDSVEALVDARKAYFATRLDGEALETKRTELDNMRPQSGPQAVPIKYPVPEE